MKGGVKKEIKIELPSNLEPVFSNMIQITHKDDEFCLTFVHVMPNVNVGKVKAVVSITPQHAKRLLKALKENIERYEKIYGEIKLVEETKRHEGVEFA
ncbi:MAG: DUF3467 domain-containing protein [Candidatus Alkanophagales archaeon]